MHSKLTYKDAGVDIDAGIKFVEKIKPLVNSTRRPGANTDLGGFGGLFDLSKTKCKNPILVGAADGVGTKLRVAVAAEKYNKIGIDLVAMCVNDIVVQGAEPIFFLDYYATGKLDVELGKEIIAGIAEGCRDAGCALIGGETAEMPGMYKGEEFDLAGFCVGVVDRTKLLTGRDVKDGDVILGLSSSGLHANGYSLVRHVVGELGLSYDSAFPLNNSLTIADELLSPTRIYVKSCLNALKTRGVKALAHITGGGIFDNIPRILPHNVAAGIDFNSWEMPQIFQWLAEVGNISHQEMYRTFNCGIGMVAIVSYDRVHEIKESLEAFGETVYTIGKIIPNRDGKQVVKTNRDSWAA